MNTMLNSLAEIQRLCMKVWSHAEGTGPAMGEEPVKVDPHAYFCIHGATRVQHPSAQFEIWTNHDCSQYLVDDNGMQSLYRLRNPIVQPKPQNNENANSSGLIGSVNDTAGSTEKRSD